MNKKLTDLTVRGKTHPKNVRELLAKYALKAGDHFIDGYGKAVTITACGVASVTFTRDGYQHPCVFPVPRFHNEFKRV